MYLNRYDIVYDYGLNFMHISTTKIQAKQDKKLEKLQKKLVTVKKRVWQRLSLTSDIEGS